MEEIHIEYETTKGQGSSSFKADTDTVKLGKKKIEILNLESLSRFSKLKRLWINDNQIEAIDLSPLTHCSNLEILSISGNNLSSIDLAPLRYCPELKELYIHKNGIESIDLEPLRHTRKLSILFLDRNRLKRIQLDPLIDSHHLSQLRLWKNLLPSVDVTPLLFLKDFKTFHFEEDKSLTMDSTVRYLSEKMDTNRFLRGALKFNRIEWLDYSSLSIRSGWSGVRSRLLDIIERTDEIYFPTLVEGFFESFR
ncbi:MAG: leucine-rich repeat domain-containing protein, partial [Candidatus Thorarchaeota archaeon]